jgi:hypothetical protein
MLTVHMTAVSEDSMQLDGRGDDGMPIRRRLYLEPCAAQVITLGGELLSNAESLLRDGLHTAEIADGYGKAAAKVGSLGHLLSTLASLLEAFLCCTRCKELVYASHAQAKICRAHLCETSGT